MYHVYFHIDLNAFFANAEVLLNPELKGKPIVISGATRRSVVSTASYEARAFGIHSAMPVSEAQKLCRELIIVEGHYTWYRNLSERFMEMVRSYTYLVEQASVDECYADMTEAIKKFDGTLVTGSLKFDAERNPEKKVTFIEVKDGKLSLKEKF